MAARREWVVDKCNPRLHLHCPKQLHSGGLPFAVAWKVAFIKEQCSRAFFPSQVMSCTCTNSNPKFICSILLLLLLLPHGSTRRRENEEQSDAAQINYSSAETFSRPTNASNWLIAFRFHVFLKSSSRSAWLTASTSLNHLLICLLSLSASV